MVETEEVLEEEEGETPLFPSADGWVFSSFSVVAVCRPILGREEEEAQNMFPP